MNFDPVRTAHIAFRDGEPPRATDYGDVYHPRAGALEQARHVFLSGNGLPGRWAARPRFVVFETGFGLGNNFLATWAAWRDDPRRCERLWYVSIEKHPPTPDDLARAHADSPLRALADELHRQWPPSTPDLHLIDFEAGRLRLLLLQADIAQALPEVIAEVDAFYLDGFAPDRNPAMWDARHLRALNRLAADGASVATWSVARQVRDALTAAGFIVSKAAGSGGKREITLGRFEPRHQPAPAPGRAAQPPRSVVVVGAGLAGACAAHALAAQGVETLVLDRQPLPGADLAGHLGGLFHGILHPEDGPHARWLRAAALYAQRIYAPGVASGALPGQVDGLLRSEPRLAIDAMRALIERQALPEAWVQAWTAEQVRARLGLPWGHRAWFYPGGGWVAPLALRRLLLRRDGITVRDGIEVHRLQRGGDGWQLLDVDGSLLAQAPAVVLANAADAVRLLGDAPGRWQRNRGQVSLWRGPHPGLPLPVADRGYALQLAHGGLLVGATTQPDDDDGAVRAEDHRANLDTLQRLTGWRPDVDDSPHLTGAVGWRMRTADRLPWIGPAPCIDPSAARRHHARQVPRQPGLHLLCGLGSRGLTQAPLAGELLASWITGAPLPLPARLVDAVDVARFAARAARLSRS